MNPKPLPVRLTAVCRLCFLAVCTATPLAAQTPGDTAPGFTLKTLEGDTVSLADFRGHPVLIYFWAAGARPAATRCRWSSRPTGCIKTPARSS